MDSAELTSVGKLQDQEAGVAAFRVVCASLGFILMSLIFWRLFLEFKHRSTLSANGIPNARRVVKFSLGINGTICFCEFIPSHRPSSDVRQSSF